MGSDGSVKVKGDIVANTFLAGNPSGFHIETSGDEI
jgi:hypothetical protein